MTTPHTLSRAGLQVSAPLVTFIETEALPGTGLDADRFWQGLADLYAAFAPENMALLAKRDALQRNIDSWHDERRGQPMDEAAYRAFLTAIGYLVDEPAPFTIAPGTVDAEVATIAAPQLVVPALNARFLLNAANARWGSLYDALYGTDALFAQPPAAGDYDPVRGQAVIARARAFLDQAVPLATGSWADFSGGTPDLRNPAQLIGIRGDNLLLRNNGLHIELVIDRASTIGRSDPIGLADIVIEAALTTIVDLEDSIAAVDAADKVAAYRNWLGLMTGTLVAEFTKGGERLRRTLNPDRRYQTPAGETICLPGRSLLFVRNVGHHMMTPALRLPDGAQAPEGILDAVVTSLIGLHDLKGAGEHRNSRRGSLYIVKPKMHGPEEAAFTNRLFDAIEDLLGLPRHTIKIGVMDEERRTSANLAACIAAVRGRVVFINTGFLDRTGDEIHTAMHAGPVVPKAAMKQARWIGAYEDRNVEIGLACGFSGVAQIGKGMWAAPDRMGEMMTQKIAHPEAGASTAWVPSPTAATLHALHYHAVDVFARQRQLAGREKTPLAPLLSLPLLDGSLSPEDIRREIDNNAQGILGYVVRWIDEGIGCSKVPDINDIGQMEDRATLRISSQLLANWLRHGLCSEADIAESFTRMARRVDEQNAATPGYRSLATSPGLAFQAALDLVFQGADQPNGYTEAVLHRARMQAKAC